MHEKAFYAIKQAIQKDCIMHYYNLKKRTVLTVDARSLSKVEQKYSQTEREALAVVWGSEKFNLYFVGTKFTIVTDHKALEVI